MIDLARLASEIGKPSSFAGKTSHEIIAGLYSALRGRSDKLSRLTGKDYLSSGVYGGIFVSGCGNMRIDAAGLFRAFDMEPSKGRPSDADAARLLLAAQSFFSLLMKYVLLDSVEHMTGRMFCKEDIITGAFAESIGVGNYRREDIYCWPLLADGAETDALLEMTRGLARRYSLPYTKDSDGCKGAQDSVKKIYETLIPRQARHALGEYYTPGWLAEHTMTQALEMSGKPVSEVSVIDPACGSGTFLVKAADAKRAAGCSAHEILSSVAGTDINPLAVLTAKTVLLLSVIDMIASETETDIQPSRKLILRIYNADLLSLGTKHSGKTEAFSFTENPASAVKYSLKTDTQAASALCNFDIVTGNPPWINWEYLPVSQKKASAGLWTEYGLFSAKGRELSFSKADISVLITYIAADRLLRDGGVIGFVIRPGVFKSARNDAGFRRFRIGGGAPLKTVRVDDLSDVRAFSGAMTRTALFYAVKGEPTSYPVPYYVWERRDADGRGGKEHTRRSRIRYDAVAGDVLSDVEMKELFAFPSDADDPSSAWMTVDGDTMDNARKILGKNSYRARTGVFTGGANAVYHLEIISCTDGTASVRNKPERAKRKAPSVVTELETDHIYPMLKGSGIRKWSAEYDTYILCPHTAATKQRPVPESLLESTAPLTLEYLRGFRDVLDERRGFSGWEKDIQHSDFHAVMRVGEYTFSPYKVAWKYIASEFVCAVIGSVNDPFLGEKLLIPNEKVMFIGTDSADEAYYLCGVLSSEPVAHCVAAYMNPTSISAHVLDKLRIPSFDPSSPLHAEIARYCRIGHSGGDKIRVESELNRCARELYGI